jgi:hypothetical protein
LLAASCCTTESQAAKKLATERPAKNVGASDTAASLVEKSAKESSASSAKEEKAEVSAKEASPAKQLVDRALQAEAAGNPAAREKLLREALAADPNYAPAHWQLGEVQVGKEWKAIPKASAEIARAGKVDEYRRRRGQAGENADNQFALAKWCCLAGLKDQERAHLVFVLQLKPNHSAANQRLKVLKRQDEQAGRGELDADRQQAREQIAALREWRPRLVAIRRDAEVRDPARRKRGLAELAAIDDPAALPAIENVFGDAKGKVGSAVIRCLANMDDQRATDSLVRYSVNAKDADIRREASQALGDRSMFSYIPSMMSILVPPTKMEYELAFDSKGDLKYRMSLYQEGPFSDVEVSQAVSGKEFMALTARPRQNDLLIGQPQLPPPNSANISAAREIEAANSAREERNQKIAEALRVSTGNKLDDAPQSWWYWWLDYNEIYRAPEKPVERKGDKTLASLTFPRVPTQTPQPEMQVETSLGKLARISHPECFVAGTKVWTMTGPMAIERVSVGESILAQNTATGELAYKLVLATTIRPVSPLMVIQAGNETIQATRGHPFWVSGVGWQMAKELKEGQWLHTANGPVEVKSVQQMGQGVAYNMLLDGFNTYFVTDSMFLVHDNLIREVSPATVPGMAIGTGRNERYSSAQAER